MKNCFDQHCPVDTGIVIIDFVNECFSGQFARMEGWQLLLPPLSVSSEEHSEKV